LHSFSTERDVVTTDEVPQGNGLLAVGSPDYEAGQSIASASHGGPGRTFRGERSACGAFASVRFGPLPGSGREAGEVAAMWDRRRPRHAMRLIGAAATEAKFKEQGPGRRILHLATHGFFLVDACASDDGAGEAPPPGKGRLIAAGESPLALSGLALAGANHRDEAPPDGEDGILTAEEIAAMDLSGVEWAVLSGCDTGLGEVRAGEGLFGLRRAFQVAGAHTVITSLWSVADDTTRAWMRDLYQERLAGASTAEAVRSASRRMIKSLKRTGLPPHPYYWAAFVALGDWR